MPSPPDSADPAGPRPKRFLIAAGTAKYENLPEERQLPSVEDDLHRIVELFQCKLGYERVLAGLGENPPHTYFSEKLSGWLKDRERKASDRIVFYYSGHGVVEGSEHYLMMTDSKESNLAGTAFLTADLGRMLNGTPIRHMIVILDTCHAGAGGGDFGVIAHKYVSSLRANYATSCGFYALAAARPKEEAREGAFSAAFVRAVQDPPSECGGDGQEYLSSYEHLVEAINKDFEAQSLIQRASVNSLAVQSAPLFIINLRYRAEADGSKPHESGSTAAPPSDVNVWNTMDRQLPRPGGIVPGNAPMWPYRRDFCPGSGRSTETSSASFYPMSWFSSSGICGGIQVRSPTP